MKKFLVATVLTLTAFAANASAEFWDAFVIRSTPTINEDFTYAGQTATQFITVGSGMKAGLGTAAADGKKVADLAAISIDRLDNYGRFIDNAGAYYGPYMNIWITDGHDHFAVIANEPSNPEWTGTTEWNMTWDILKGKTVKVYETSDKSWLPNSGVGLTFASLAGFTIQAPTVAQLGTGWAGLGTGAPRELGTNVAYGFNWVFGDTLSNYVSDGTGFVVANPTLLVPEPSTIALLITAGLGLIGYGLRRRANG